MADIIIALKLGCARVGRKERSMTIRAAAGPDPDERENLFKKFRTNKPFFWDKNDFLKI